MNLAKQELHLTVHGHERYCERVEPITYPELKQQCETSMAERDYHRRNYFLQISDVWWKVRIKKDRLILVTCYGRCDFYSLPEAIEWARKSGDRIRLGN